MKLKESIALSENGFIFNAATGDSFTTNETGRRILQLVRQGKSVEEIVEALTQEFDADAHVCDKDVREFLGLLQQWHLVEAAPSR